MIVAASLRTRVIEDQAVVRVQRVETSRLVSQEVNLELLFILKREFSYLDVWEVSEVRKLCSSPSTVNS